LLVAQDEDVDSPGGGIRRRPRPDHLQVRAVQPAAEGLPAGGGARDDEDPRHARPSTQRRAASLVIATARSPPSTSVLTPTTAPRASTSGPPEQPGPSRTS